MDDAFQMFRRSREGGNPETVTAWIPAFAGMTAIFKAVE
jgi:hypothetical protein